MRDGFLHCASDHYWRVLQTCVTQFFPCRHGPPRASCIGAADFSLTHVQRDLQYLDGIACLPELGGVGFLNGQLGQQRHGSRTVHRSVELCKLLNNWHRQRVHPAYHESSDFLPSPSNICRALQAPGHSAMPAHGPCMPKHLRRLLKYPHGCAGPRPLHPSKFVNNRHYHSKRALSLAKWVMSTHMPPWQPHVSGTGRALQARGQPALEVESIVQTLASCKWKCRRLSWDVEHQQHITLQLSGPACGRQEHCV